MIDKIKIALIDDEPLFLEGLSLLFSNVKNIVVTNTATNGVYDSTYFTFNSNNPYYCDNFYDKTLSLVGTIKGTCDRNGKYVHLVNQSTGLDKML